MGHEEQPGCEVLRVLVGSHAHGLAGPGSDRDERAVVVWPTRELPGIRIGARSGPTERRTGAVELAAYEAGRFLALALRSNPTVLEVFRAPVLAATADGRALRELFPAVWDAELAYRAFPGYAAASTRG